MLSRFDEYLIHQTPEPLAHPVSMDRNVYDRYWLGGFSADGQGCYFAASLGLYPNRQVMDAGFSVVHRGVQHAFFNDHRPEVYAAAEAEVAWETTISFLSSALG